MLNLMVVQVGCFTFLMNNIAILRWYVTRTRVCKIHTNKKTEGNKYMFNKIVIDNLGIFY